MQSRASDYHALLDAIQAVPDSRTKQPAMPVSTACQEAVNLAKWAVEDKTELIEWGLDWEAVEALGPRASALMHAEVLLLLHENERKRAVLAWKREYPKAEKLRSFLVRRFKYALEDREEALEILRNITGERSRSGRIQQFRDLSAFGRKHSGLLQAVNFDMSKLNEALQWSRELSILLADVHTAAGNGDMLVTRNRAYAYLKEAVDQVYKAGKLALWHNKKRLPGYASEYLREKMRRYKEKKRRLNAKSAESAIAPSVKSPAKDPAGKLCL